MPRIEISKIGRGGKSPRKALKCERDVYYSEATGFQKTSVYDGAAVLAGMELEGPCIVEERMTSIVVPPGEKLIVDDYGNFITADSLINDENFNTAELEVVR
jgi:N-methylhydantoinase A/oxoprolinase/acetone carboxylase beta subunit